MRNSTYKTAFSESCVSKSIILWGSSLPSQSMPLGIDSRLEIIFLLNFEGTAYLLATPYCCWEVGYYFDTLSNQWNMHFYYGIS